MDPRDGHGHREFGSRWGRVYSIVRKLLPYARAAACGFMASESDNSEVCQTFDAAHHHGGSLR